MPTTTLPAMGDFPGLDLAFPLQSGGWVKRSGVPLASLPHLPQEQSPCPTNGHLDAKAIGYRRHLTCTAHWGDDHYAASAGHILAVWPDESGQR